MTTISDPARFERAIALFDAANAEDPNLDEGRPKELLYAERMTEMLGRFAPDASEAVQLACRCEFTALYRLLDLNAGCCHLKFD